MSLSPGLYKAYGTLYDKFSTDLFTFEDFRKTTGLGLASSLKCASLLRARGYMIIFSRSGRTRKYRLLSPEQALFAHLHMKNLGAVRQQRYVHLLVGVCMQLHRSSLGLLGEWLSAMRVRRVALKSGWMWLLPPDLKVGEPVGVQKTVKGIPRPS